MRTMDGLSAFLLDQELTGAYMHSLKISILNTSEGWDFHRLSKGFGVTINDVFLSIVE